MDNGRRYHLTWQESDWVSTKLHAGTTARGDADDQFKGESAWTEVLPNGLAQRGMSVLIRSTPSQG